MCAEYVNFFIELPHKTLLIMAFEKCHGNRVTPEEKTRIGLTLIYEGLDYKHCKMLN